MYGWLLNNLSSPGVNYGRMEWGSDIKVSRQKPVVAIQVKPFLQYFHLVLHTALYMLVLNLESVAEILWCDHSDEISPAVLWKMLFVFPCFTT